MEELIRTIEIRIETTEECIDNINLDMPFKNALIDEITFLKLVIENLNLLKPCNKN
jgi:hypothetical protein